MNDTTTRLAVAGLEKSFGAVRVLDGISLTARQGDVVSILGASGSGKSTFLRCLNFLDTADAGTITIKGDTVDLTGRMLSNGQPHRALPLAASLCTAVAARIEGSLVHAVCASGATQRLRLGMPSGVLSVGAEVGRDGALWHATRGSFYRTARRLFDGFVYA